MAPNETVLIERHDHILKIQLNRPEKKNALSPDMYTAMREALIDADADPSIHVIYITGSGDSFSAGNDLKTFVGDPTSTAAADFIRTVSTTQTPLVAAVNGLAVGVGVTLLLHCDLAYAAEGATFNFAFIDLALVPEAASSYLLPLMAGQRQAAELMMIGGKFSAEKAQSVGIVNSVHAADDLHDVAWDAAQTLANKPPEALRLVKQLLKRGTEQAIADTMDAEFAIFGQRLQSEEVMTIMQAFLQRKPTA